MPWRLLRIAASTLAAILSLALIALAIRSYGTFDRLRIGNNAVASMNGRLLVNDVFNTSTTRPDLERWYVHRGFYNGRVTLWTGPVGAFIPLGVGWRLSTWLLVVVALAAIAAPWISWSNRFSLRTLLIATTLAALLLSLAVYTTAN